MYEIWSLDMKQTQQAKKFCIDFRINTRITIQGEKDAQ